MAPFSSMRFTSAVSLQTIGGSNLGPSFTQTFTGRVVANITVNLGLDPEDDADTIYFDNAHSWLGEGLRE
jgi:hypothetical protein